MSLSSMLKKLDSKYKQYQQDSDKRAKERIARLETSTARAEERARLQSRQMKAKRELVLAKTQLKKAELERRKIEKKTGNSFLDTLRSLSAPPKKHRSTVKRRKSKR